MCMSIELVNPLSPNFFPQQYIFVYIQHMPHSQVLLSHSVCSSGARLGGTSAHGEPPLAKLRITTQEPSKWGSEWRLDWFSCRTSPPLGLDLSSGTPHTVSVHVFLSAKCPLWGHQSGLWTSLNPKHQGGCTPFHTHKPRGCLVKGAHQNLTKWISLWPKLGPKPQKAHLWYWDLRPQNTTKSTSTCTAQELASKAILGEAVHQVHHTVYMDVMRTGSTSCALQDIGMGYGVP